MVVDTNQHPASDREAPQEALLASLAAAEEERRHLRHYRVRHRRRRSKQQSGPRRVRMRFAWWHLGVALLSIAFGGWVVFALQPWSEARPPSIVTQ